MMMIFPWWRADSLSSQRGNSSKILLGSMDNPEMDQKCCSSCRRIDTHKQHFLSKSKYFQGTPVRERERPPLTLTVRRLIMRTGSELAERGRPTK